MDQPLASPQDVPVRFASLETGVSSKSAHATPARDHRHHRGLLLIGLFKLSKATLAVLSAVAAYRLASSDMGALAERLVSALPIDPVGRIARIIMDEADNQPAFHLRYLGEISIVLAVLYLIEGTGLMAELVWAEYLTVIMTGAAMPYEIYHMVEHYTILRLGLLLSNTAVVVYLAAVLRQKNRRRSTSR